MTKSRTETLIFTTLDTSQSKKLMIMKNIHSRNPLYLIINSAAGLLLKKNDNKHLILNSGDKYEEVWCGIWSEIKTINH